MNRRQKIIVSVVGIFIVLLALFGITYGYFLTRIQGNTNTTSITVTTADLKLVYGDGNGSVTPAGVIMPDNENYIMFSNNTDSKTFTVTNDGNATVENYVVVVEDINVTYASNATLEDGTAVTLGQPTTFNRPEDFVYVLSCKAYTGYGTVSQTAIGTCNEVTSETVLPMEDSILLMNTIDEDVTHAYELKIKYLNPDIDQSKDMNKTFNLKVNIEDIRNFNPYKEGTLANAIFTNNKVTKNNNTPIFDGVTTEEEGIYPASDDYGVSWYFRGAQQNNYVNFAGFTWRIVRINGDGSIRLILDGTLDKICVEYNPDNTCKTYAGTTSAFNTSYTDNAHVGYMYGLAGTTTNANRCLKLNGTTVTDYISTYGTQKTCETNGGKWTTTAYEATHANVKDSTIKGNVDTFYETYIENGTTKQYEKYLADTLFCGDKTLADQDGTDDNIGGVATQLGYGTGSSNKTYYAATERLYYSSGTTSITTANPTLKCAENANNNYSRYTSTIDTSNTLSNGLSINNDLKHPIALLSADELVMAGAFKSEKNQAYYLYDSYANGTSSSTWWSLSPYLFNGSNAYESFSSASGSSLRYSIVNGIPDGSRPVINLRSNLLIESGDGTSGNGAYTVKLPS